MSGRVSFRSISRDEWDAMTLDQQVELFTDSALELLHNQGARGATVDESDVPAECLEGGR